MLFTHNHQHVFSRVPRLPIPKLLIATMSIVKRVGNMTRGEMSEENGGRTYPYHHNPVHQQPIHQPVPAPEQQHRQSCLCFVVERFHPPCSC